MKKLILIALCGICAVLRAADERPLEFYDPDVQRLIKTEVFAFGGVGVAGRTSDGEAAFAAVVKKTEAIRYVLAAFEYGNDHARCYALVALRESSPQLFRESMARLRKRPPKQIVTMSGCIMSHGEPEHIFKAIEAGEYAEWFKRHEEIR